MEIGGFGLVEEVMFFGEEYCDFGFVGSVDYFFVVYGVIGLDDCFYVGVDQYLCVVCEWEECVGGGDGFGCVIVCLFYGEVV